MKRRVLHRVVSRGTGLNRVRCYLDDLRSLGAAWSRDLRCDGLQVSRSWSRVLLDNRFWVDNSRIEQIRWEG